MFAAKLILALAALWSVAGILALALMPSARRAALSIAQFNFIGGPVLLALALRGWLVDSIGHPRAVDVALGTLLLALLCVFAWS